VTRLGVVHVGLGPIGIAVARAAAARSDLSSVAAVDPLFAGLDLGEVMGGPASGVQVAGSLAEALRGGGIDVALHCTGSHLAQVEPQLHELIAAGLSVVSTCEELSWPWFHHPLEAGRLDAAARAAGVRLLGTGVNPGFVMDLLPVVLSAMTLRVDSVRVERVVDASLRRKPLQLKIGSGLEPEVFRARGRAGTLGHMGLLESVAMIGAALGWELDEIEQTLDPLVAEGTIRTDALEVAAGQVRGLHQVATGSVGGERRITLDLTMMLDAPDPRDVVRLEGEPTLQLRMEGGIHGDVATVAAVVGAVPRLHRAPVGLVSVLDLPSAVAATGPVG
jgi:2,4-diaminopentanoate dehydrogenase